MRRRMALAVDGCVKDVCYAGLYLCSGFAALGAKSLMIPDCVAAIRARRSYGFSHWLAAIRAHAGLPGDDAQAVRAHAADSRPGQRGQSKQDQDQKRHHAAGYGPAQHITALVGRHQPPHQTAYNHQNGKMHSSLSCLFPLTADSLVRI